MNRFITNPNSKIDRLFLSVLITLITMHYSWWISGQFKDMANDYWWIWFPTIIGFGVVITFAIVYLYWNLYSACKQLERLRHRTFKYLYTPYEGLKESKVLKLIEDICKATNVPIEERKPLFDDVCNFYIDFFPDHTISGQVSVMWKRAIIDYRKYEIWND